MKRVIAIGLILFGVSTTGGSAEAATKTIGIVIFDGVLTSEVTAPIEVFGHGQADDEIRFKIQMIAESRNVVQSHEGLRLVPDLTFADSPTPDILIVPSSYNL